MHGRRSGPRAVAAVVTVAALLVACLVLPVLAQSPSPSPLPSPSGARLDPSLVAELEAALASSESLAAAVQAMRTAEQERIGLAAADPQLPAVLAELEAMAGADLAAYLGAMPPMPEPSGEPGPQGSPQAALASDFVAGVRGGPRGPNRVRVVEQVSTLSSAGQLWGFVQQTVAGFTPSKESGTWDPPPFTSTESTTVAGREVGRSLRYSIRGAGDRDRLTLSIELSQQYQIAGPTPEAPGYQVSDSGQATMTIDTCPEEDATVAAGASSQGTYEISGGDLGQRIVLEATDEVVADVDHEAFIYRREHDQQVRRTASGSHADGSDAGSDFGARLGWTVFGQGHGTMPASSVQVTANEGAERADIGTSMFAGIITSSIADHALDGAQAVWRAGKCLELEVEPAGRQVDPGSETSITATIRHKAFDEEVDRPVRAVLAGTKRLEPNDEPVQPAEFTYTASSESTGEGTITFSSVSNRGIAEERTETYTVDQRLRLDAQGSMSIEAGGMRYRTTYRGRGLKVTLVPGDSAEAPPTVRVEGKLSLRGRASGLLGQANCTGRFRATAAIDPGPDVSAQLMGEGDERRLSVHLWTSEPDAAIDFPMRCRFPTGPTTVPYSIQVRDTWPIWSGLGTAVELPLEGGTANERKSDGRVSYDSKLVLRTEDER